MSRKKLLTILAIIVVPLVLVFSYLNVNTDLFRGSYFFVPPTIPVDVLNNSLVILTEENAPNQFKIKIGSIVDDVISSTDKLEVWIDDECLGGTEFQIPGGSSGVMNCRDLMTGITNTTDGVNSTDTGFIIFTLPERELGREIYVKYNGVESNTLQITQAPTSQITSCGTSSASVTSALPCCLAWTCFRLAYV